MIFIIYTKLVVYNIQSQVYIKYLGQVISVHYSMNKSLQKRIAKSMYIKRYVSEHQMYEVQIQWKKEPFHPYNDKSQIFIPQHLLSPFQYFDINSCQSSVHHPSITISSKNSTVKIESPYAQKIKLNESDYMINSQEDQIHRMNNSSEHAYKRLNHQKNNNQNKQFETQYTQSCGNNQDFASNKNCESTNANDKVVGMLDYDQLSSRKTIALKIYQRNLSILPSSQTLPSGKRFRPYSSNSQKTQKRDISAQDYQNSKPKRKYTKKGYQSKSNQIQKVIFKQNKKSKTKSKSKSKPKSQSLKKQTKLRSKSKKKQQKTKSISQSQELQNQQEYLQKVQKLNKSMILKPKYTKGKKKNAKKELQNKIETQKDNQNHQLSLKISNDLITSSQNQPELPQKVYSFQKNQ